MTGTLSRPLSCRSRPSTWPSFTLAAREGTIITTTLRPPSMLFRRSRAALRDSPRAPPHAPPKRGTRLLLRPPYITKHPSHDTPIPVPKHLLLPHFLLLFRTDRSLSLHFLHKTDPFPSAPEKTKKPLSLPSSLPSLARTRTNIPSSPPLGRRTSVVAAGLFAGLYQPPTYCPYFPGTPSRIVAHIQTRHSTHQQRRPLPFFS